MKFRNSAIRSTLWRHIHPQLPLEPRQTLRLQQLLSNSFRHRLREEHPHNEASASQPTDAHIRRLLSSPLFSGPATSAKGREKASEETVIASLQTALCSPVELFETQVSVGQATLQTATRMLYDFESLHRLGEGSTALNDSSKALQVVLNWLWSSGLEESLEFLHDKRFVKALMRLITRERKDEVFWRWFDALNAQQTSLDSPRELTASIHATRQMMTQYCFDKGFEVQSADGALAALRKALQRVSDQSHSIAALSHALANIPLWTMRYSWSGPYEETYHDLILRVKFRSAATLKRTMAGFDLVAADPDPKTAWDCLSVLDASETISLSSQTKGYLLMLCERAMRLLRVQNEDAKVELLKNKVLPQLSSKLPPVDSSSRRSRSPSPSSAARTSHSSDEFHLGVT